MGTRIKVVPEEHWDILKQYLNHDAVVLVRESVLETLDNEAQANALRNGEPFIMDYDFGGEADVWVDLVEDADHMAWGYMFQDEANDDKPSTPETLTEETKQCPQRFRKTDDGWFTYYVNVDTGEKKLKLDATDILVDGAPDDFSRKGGSQS